MKTTYVIEPRHEDGTLNVKSNHWGDNALTRFWNNATEDQIFQHYFRTNENAVSFQEVKEWYKKQGLSIRIKTW